MPAYNNITQLAPLNYIDGELVIPTDLNNDNNFSRNLTGLALAQLLGATDALPKYNALTLTATGGMNLLLGGAGQTVFVGGRVVDTIPAQIITVPTANATNPRIDLISIQYVENNAASPFSREVEDTFGNKTSTTVYYQNENIAYTYTQGTPAATPAAPATPANYAAFAQVYVGAGVVSISSGNVTIVLQSTTALLNTIPQVFVNSLNNFNGAVSIVGGTGILVTNGSNNQIVISLPSLIYNTPAAWSSKKVHTLPLTAGARNLLINPSIIPPFGIFKFDIRSPDTQLSSNTVSGAAAVNAQEYVEPYTIATGTSGQQYLSGTTNTIFDSIGTSATLASNSRLLANSGTTLVSFDDDGSTHKLSAFANHCYGRSFAYTNSSIFPVKLILQSLAPAPTAPAVPASFELECAIIGGVGASYGVNSGPALFTSGTTNTATATITQPYFNPGAVGWLGSNFPGYGQNSPQATITYTVPGNSSDYWNITAACTPSRVTWPTGAPYANAPAVLPYLAIQSTNVNLQAFWNQQGPYGAGSNTGYLGGTSTGPTYNSYTGGFTPTGGIWGGGYNSAYPAGYSADITFGICATLAAGSTSNFFVVRGGDTVTMSFGYVSYNAAGSVIPTLVSGGTLTLTAYHQ